VPIYEYECRKCGHRFEVIQKISDPPVKKCEKCKKGKPEKLISSPAIQFKGTGWYVTDYAKSGQEAAKAEKAEKSAESTKSKSSEKSSSKKKDKAGTTGSSK
jgi:putative FmdB family regulatory protein